ncbi:MAG TPA: conjugal transfer protein TraF [Marinospirillum sp.]|uniref:conjugal transfer protein TraF n=1 Tax=Marinospirillum sp. TaxID=2183934 RepID=UPI002B494ED3|nr:conjugal transfer protein TraF [Marinospirillum sp.]HKM15326.1 conjugal transfer protein TraF [Marinospirillum sp.]
MKNLLKPSRLALAVAAIALPLTATANQSLNAAGYASTIGGVINEGSVHSSSFNPAGNNLLVNKTDKFRFGYLSNLGGYVEIGESDDLDKKVDGLVDDMDAVDNFTAQDINYLKSRYGDLGNNEAAYYEAIANRANTEIIADLEKGGQLRAGGQLQVPLTPFLIRSNSARGTFSINAAASMQMKGAFLSGPLGVKTTFKTNNNQDLGSLDIDLVKAAGAYKDIETIVDGSDTTANKIAAIKAKLLASGILTEQNKTVIEDLQKNPTKLNSIDTNKTESTITTDSGLDIKAAVVTHLGFGYGTNLTNWLELNDKHGQLEAGVRLNIYNVEAGRNFVSLQAEANDNNEDSDTSDKLTEDFLDNTTTTTGVGLDLGFLWHSDNYQAGITFYNLNEPSFDYPDLNTYLSKTDGTLTALQGLEAAGKTKVADSVTLTRHAVIEGAYYTDNRNWMIQGAYTLGTATNFVGDEFQNLHLSAGYYPKTAWIPGLRAGYSKNMKGSELSKIHAGATFFGIMHLDLAVATNKSSFDGDEIPRYAAISLGFEEKF